MVQTTRCGIPTTTQSSGTPLLMSEFAPITTLLPMVTPLRMVAFIPMNTLSEIFTLPADQSTSPYLPLNTDQS